jgi:hypothetical protein
MNIYLQVEQEVALQPEHFEPLPADCPEPDFPLPTEKEDICLFKSSLLQSGQRGTLLPITKVSNFFSHLLQIKSYNGINLFRDFCDQCCKE